MNRNDPSERMWSALKELARREPEDVSQSEAIRRVKAVAKNEGALDLPGAAIEYYAREYRSMVTAWRCRSDTSDRAH